MANNYFQFKQFKITQSNAAMKVGTDGVLLGAWADCSKASKILDIGTGTGLIALMLAQRCQAKIVGIDIDENAIKDAEINTSASEWNNRITIHKSSIQTYAENGFEGFDLILSNPPFFENSLKSENSSRTAARHTDGLSSSELLESSVKLLNPNGKICVVIPTDNFQNYQSIAHKMELHISRLTWVKPTPNKEAKRVLIEFSKQAQETHEETLIIEEFGRHKYSEAYIELTKDFYLKM